MKASRSAVIIPLYQYPLTKETWLPLYTQISDNPSLNFIVIINPNSGPGVDPAGWLPDKRYTRAIARLASYDNVKLVGYIRLDYCRRDFQEVVKDVQKYANWSGTNKDLCKERGKRKGKQELAMHGIFFDEVPNLYSDEVAHFLGSVGSLVRSIHEIEAPRLIIHNPGTVPDAEFSDYWQKANLESDIETHNYKEGENSIQLQATSPLSDREQTRVCSGAPDVTVVFESSYQVWTQEPVQKRLHSLLRGNRSQRCFMVHSTTKDGIKTLIPELTRLGRYIFVTELCEQPYEKYDNDGLVGFIDELVAQNETEFA